MATTFNTPFMQKPDSGYRLGDIRAIYDAIVSNNANSAAYGITAVGTTQATALQLTSVINQVDTAAASTGVNLPLSTGTRSVPFQFCYIVNNGANTITVYAAQGSSDTINGTAGATGITQPVGTNSIYVSAKPGTWEVFGAGSAGSFTSLTVSGTSTLAAVSESDNLTFTAVAKGVIFKQGANGKVGTFTLAGTAPVTVSNTSIATTDCIVISLNTVGGTVGAVPAIKTITAATGFTVAGTVADVSIYNYAVLSNAI